MAANDYHFITEWHIPATLEEIYAILSDANDLPRWWRSVYLEVETLAPGEADGLNKVVSLYTKGWLPYTLRWQFRVTDVQSTGFTLEASGDFVGRGVWTFTAQEESVLARYDWRISAEKGLLKTFSFLLKPFFSLNHHWAMGMGEESLRIELMRRRARMSAEAAQIPPPPPATPSEPLAWLAFITGVRVKTMTV